MQAGEEIQLQITSLVHFHEMRSDSRIEALILSRKVNKIYILSQQVLDTQ